VYLVGESTGGFMGQMTRGAATGEGWYRACWWRSVPLPPPHHTVLWTCVPHGMSRP
jgi:hypothetical protein